MASKERTIEKALEMLKAALLGLRYSDLVRRIGDAFTDNPKNTIQGTLSNIDTHL